MNEVKAGQDARPTRWSKARSIYLVTGASNSGFVLGRMPGLRNQTDVMMLLW
ncbi:MAG: hypothetical protein WBD64_05015 [Candidatus Zixiibacteriota bacterium]